MIVLLTLLANSQGLGCWIVEFFLTCSRRQKRLKLVILGVFLYIAYKLLTERLNWNKKKNKNPKHILPYFFIFCFTYISLTISKVFNYTVCLISKRTRTNPYYRYFIILVVFLSTSSTETINFFLHILSFFYFFLYFRSGQLAKQQIYIALQE